MNGFRNRLIAAVIASVLLVPAARSADSHIHIRQADKANDGNDVGRTEIVVDGKSTLGYDSLVNDTLDIWVAAYIDKSKSTPDYQSFILMAEATEIAGEITAAARRYKISVPYADPRSGSVSGQRNSAIQTCNNRLGSLSGAARAVFLREGSEINVTNAYRLKAVATYITTRKKKKKVFQEAPDIVENTDEATAMANAIIVCRPLDRPRARTGKPTTTGATPKPGKPLPPVIAAATLRIEPAQIKAINKQNCPTELKLYAGVEAARAFEGKAVIFGTGFLSPVTALSYNGPGNRNIVATYPLSWAKSGGLANTATGPKSQMVTLTLNVTNADNKVQESVKETVTVTCRPMRMGTDNAVGGATGAADHEALASPADPQMWSWHEAVRASEPAAARKQRVGEPLTVQKRTDMATPLIDAHVRKVDRSGPGGATRVWLRNGGTERAVDCVLAVKRDSDIGWIVVGSVQLGAGETKEIAAKMPRDPALEFAVTCPGEREDMLANNIARLP